MRLSALNALKYLVVPSMLLLAPGAARADFTGVFAPVNWAGTGDLLSHTTATLIMGTTSGTFDRTLSIPLPFSAMWSFDFAFGSPAGGADGAGYLINGSFTSFASGNTASGSISVPVLSGQTIGYRLVGDEFNFSTLTITNFAPPVPEPSSLVLLGIGAAGVFLARRRRRAV